MVDWRHGLALSGKGRDVKRRKYAYVKGQRPVTKNPASSVLGWGESCPAASVSAGKALRDDSARAEEHTQVADRFREGM